MTGLSILKLLLTLINNLLQYLQNKKVIDNWQAHHIKKRTSDIEKIINEAKQIRRAANDKFDESDGVPDDSDSNLRD